MTCGLCSGAVEQRLATYMQEYKGRKVIIENVPAEVCTQCGERLLTPEVAKRIQKVVWEQPSPKRSEEIPIYDLADVA